MHIKTSLGAITLDAAINFCTVTSGFGMPNSRSIPQPFESSAERKILMHTAQWGTVEEATQRVGGQTPTMSRFRGFFGMEARDSSLMESLDFVSVAQNVSICWDRAQIRNEIKRQECRAILSQDALMSTGWLPRVRMSCRWGGKLCHSYGNR